MKIIWWLLMGSLCFGFDKVMIAHRGASGYLPEHSLEAKVLAHAFGADYIEQDVVMSKDNELIIIHDLYLDKLSDVASKFPNRAREDGHYYVIDFTLAELRSLRMSESFIIKNKQKIPTYPKRFPVGASYFHVHTLQEEIELIQGLNKTLHKDVGLYVEIKRPWFHTKEGKDIAKATLEVLKQYGYTKKSSNVYLQSFDFPNLVYIKKQLLPQMKMDLKLIALVAKSPSTETYVLEGGEWKPYDFSYFLEEKNYAYIASIVDGLGPNYGLLFDLDATKKGHIVPNDFVKRAHLHGLQVHPYTIRRDSLPPYATSATELYEAVLFGAGADGVFSDFVDEGIEFLQSKKR